MPKPRFSMYALLALLLPALAAAADVYRWTDAQGTVHYSDQPHPGASAVTVDPGAAAAPSGGGRNAGEADAAPSKAERADAIRVEQCEKANERLAKLQNAATVTTTGPDGEKRELSADERVQAIARAESDVAGLCGDED